jgi:uncharacterized lipoprotein YmbA
MLSFGEGRKMKNMKKILFVIMALTLDGCAGILGKAKPDRTRLYLLQNFQNFSQDIKDLRPATRKRYIIAIDAITIPTYLQSPHLVYEDADKNFCGEIRWLRDCRWAEPLGEGLGRILRQQLAITLTDDCVIAAPWPATIAPDFMVKITVENWIPVVTQRVFLRARCELLRNKDGRLFASRTYFIHHPVDEATAEFLIPAMEATAVEFAKNLANDLKQALLNE